MIEHVSVCHESGTFCGWPANHGAWQWGDELLVGFIRGGYGQSAMHNVVGPLEKVQARSLDGGMTWNVEAPNVDFECEEPTSPPSFDLNSAIIRVCGGYDHGGEFCHPNGGFYLSIDKGQSWRGPFSFDGIQLPEGEHLTARTRVHKGLVFLSAADRRHWGSDYIFCARHDGARFHRVSTVCDDQHRAVMPAVASIGDRIVLVARRRGSPRVEGWIDAFVSDDRGETWTKTSEVAVTGKNNGNPPALIECDGRLYCAYGNRTEQAINVSVSDDGEHWSGFVQLRKGINSDIGYPQLFKRTDGKLVCVYYFTVVKGSKNTEATIFDGQLRVTA
jgi:hypothetical protein